MLSDLFKSTPVVDDGTREWIFDTYAWAIEHFELSVFRQSQLILPTNAFYPGSVKSVHAMAQAVFEQTLKYAGMENWPIKLVVPQLMSNSTTLPRLNTSTVLRGDLAQISVVDEALKTIEISYNPSQVNQPQDLVSSFTQILATILVMQSHALPPGGKDCLPQAIDLVACFMGFGVIFANTAYQFRGGCGSCNNRSANRQASLPEEETVYALALFCVLKSTPKNAVLPHLKAHLKKLFKRSYKELTKHIQHSENRMLLAALN